MECAIVCARLRIRQAFPQSLYRCKVCLTNVYNAHKDMENCIYHESKGVHSQVPLMYVALSPYFTQWFVCGIWEEPYLVLILLLQD